MEGWNGAAHHPAIGDAGNASIAFVTLGERHLLVDYYHRTRTHLALGNDPPDGRTVQGPEAGAIIAFPAVGGLHHRYERRAAA